MRTYLEAKAMAKSLRTALAAKDITLSHSECLELVSKQIGFDEWNMLSAKIALETGERNAQPAAGISLEPAVAVIQIGSVPDAKKFYVDFLGFTVDWGWSENDGERSLYAQISRSGVTLHLSTHGVERGATELLIRMSGLATLHAELLDQDICSAAERPSHARRPLGASGYRSLREPLALQREQSARNFQQGGLLTHAITRLKSGES